jgi:hypothetical protein
MLAIRNHPPANVERYLWAVLAQIPFCLAANAWWGIWSVEYAAVYVFFTGLILWCICRIALDCLRERQYRLRAAAIMFILAVMLVKMAFTGLPRPVDGFAMISLIEGFVLAWCGSLCAFLAPYTRRPDLIFPLAVFWLALALYDFGWVLHGRMWDRINWLVPPALGVCCFSLLAWRLRAKVAVGRVL